MKLRLSKKEIQLTLEFLEGKQDVEKGTFNGGVREPKFLDELMIDVKEGERYDFDLDEDVPTGKYEIQLEGSARAFRELGKYLIAITEYQTQDPRYHDHFDDLLNSDAEEFVDLVIYKPEN